MATTRMPDRDKRPTGKTDNGPGVPPPPAPTPNNKATSTGAAFNAFINAHSIMRPYADLIWKWAGVYGVDKVVAAALFWRESFAAAAAQGADPATIESPTGAGVGIGQINPIHVGEKAPWGKLTQADLTNPAKNIRWSMWFFKQKLDKFGNPDAAYNKGYNPGYKGPALTSLLSKGYVPRSGLSPSDEASVDVEKSGEKSALTDPWVTIDKNGKLGFSNTVEPPKNVVTWGAPGVGAPLRQSQFASLYNTYNDIAIAYTGKDAGAATVAKWIKTGWSPTTVATVLSKTPAFTKSPVWKKSAPGIVGVAKSLYGQDWKPDNDLVRRAIVDNWDQATLETNLRSRPEYEKGPVFQDDLAKKINVFQQIYGTPGDDVKDLIKQKAKAGWTNDQLAQWLRSLPAYKGSAEYRSKELSLLDALGFVTGQQVTLSKGGERFSNTETTAQVGGGDLPYGAQFEQPNSPVTTPGLKAGLT